MFIALDPSVWNTGTVKDCIQKVALEMEKKSRIQAIKPDKPGKFIKFIKLSDLDDDWK